MDRTPLNALSSQKETSRLMWNSPIPEPRWQGFRRVLRGAPAFTSLDNFEKSQVSELQEALADHESTALGRLLKEGKKAEAELFVRTHGPNPIFNPQEPLDVAVGVARADVVNLATPASPEANAKILNGEVVHVLFQAGEASRFQAGPLYALSPVAVAKTLLAAPPSPDDEIAACRDILAADVARIEAVRKDLPRDVSALIVDGELGPKQPLLIRAAIRRVVQREVDAGRIKAKTAVDSYRQAIANQKILFFVSRRGNVAASHDAALQKFSFYGFNPGNLATIEQELVRGLLVDGDGVVSLFDNAEAADAGGHLYALVQASRDGDFTTYTESGKPIKPMEMDAFSYFINRGARVMNVVRINDMDRHTTEIVNAKALSYALARFAEGYVNVIETVANPDGQKGGTGTTFGDPETHMLTETHENSFPALSRAFEAARQEFLQKSGGRHPSYNAMRQWADLGATRRVIREYGARIVFVPRQKNVGGEDVCYLGADMPMGDLSLLMGPYRSRMFQFAGTDGKELLIHDMKKKDNLPIATRTVLRQLEDPHVVAAAEELLHGDLVAFEPAERRPFLYGAPTPEFE